jgi:hypothetical protein
VFLNKMFIFMVLTLFSASNVSAAIQNSVENTVGETPLVTIDFSEINGRRQSLMDRELKKELGNPNATATDYLRGLIVFGYQNKTGRQLKRSISIKVKRLDGNCQIAEGCNGKIVYDIILLDKGGQPVETINKTTSLARLTEDHYRNFGSKRQFDNFLNTKRSFRLRKKSQGSRSWAPLFAVAGDAVVELLSDRSTD